MIKLKRVYNNIIPFEGFLAITFVPFVFIKDKYKKQYTPTSNRHETTHGYQQIEMFIIGCILTIALYFFGCGWWSLIPLGLFFEWYLIEWLIKVPICFFACKDAYRSISFEQEAFATQGNVEYNKNRKHFAWVKYIFKLK